jgi:serine protease SohB
MRFLEHYGLFLLETITLTTAILIVFAGIFALLNRNKQQPESLIIKKLNEKYDDLAEELNSTILDKKEFKALKQALKKDKKGTKDKKNKSLDAIKKRTTYVLNFEGDIKATAVENLREEISALLTVAKPNDEVIVNIDSGGGTVTGYGLAASQLQRIRDNKLHLTVCIDEVAASGGYLMAAVAHQILAAPFAIIGSIGVLMQQPNLNRLLKKHNIDYEMLTSGEYKRTITVFGENTEKGRQKCKEELEAVHYAFKQHIINYRPHLDINTVSTGEHWLAKKALELGLIDGLMTSDDYLMKKCKDNDVYELAYERKKTLSDKIPKLISAGISNILNTFRVYC